MRYSSELWILVPFGGVLLIATDGSLRHIHSSNYSSRLCWVGPRLPMDSLLSWPGQVDLLNEVFLCYACAMECMRSSYQGLLPIIPWLLVTGYLTIADLNSPHISFNLQLSEKYGDNRLDYHRILGPVSYRHHSSDFFSMQTYGILLGSRTYHKEWYLR